MPRTPEQRGAEAIAVSKNPILQDAIGATQEWALQSFHGATNADEAWNARLRAHAVEEFVAYLLAVITLGRNATDQLVAKHDKLSERRKRRESVVEYLNTAREERAKYVESQQKVADG